MKKIGLITLLFFLFQKSADSVELKDTFAVAGGITSFSQLQSDASGAIETENTQTVGIYSGVFGEMPLKGNLVLSPGLFLSQKGAENINSKLRASYLETSAQLKWYFVNNFDFRFYLGAGLGFGILLSAEELSSNGTVTDNFQGLAKNELSGQGGLGIEFSLSNETALQLGGSYVRGLTSHLNAETSQGKSGNWEGFYGFAALRFRPDSEDDSPEKRARDYVNFKYQNFRNDQSLSRDTIPELAPKESEGRAVIEFFPQEEMKEDREPASQAKVPKRLTPKKKAAEPIPRFRESESWEEENIDSWDNNEPESW